MATSGTILSGYATTSRFYLNWQIATQDIANNRTLINWQAGINIEGGYYWGSNAVRIDGVNINGSGNLGSGTWSNLSGPGNRQLLSGSIWIDHNSDGNKSFGASIAGWFYSDGNRSASGSWALPTIPRNSQVTTNASNYTLGDPVVIYTNRKSDSFSHGITIRQNNAGGTVIKTIYSVGSSYTWTPTAGEITTMEAMIPNSNALTIYINQHNDQVNADSAVAITLNLTAANPTFTTFTYKDSNTAVATITGNDQVLVKGKSTLQVDVIAANKMTAIKSSTASHYAFGFDGTSVQANYSASTTVIGSFANVTTIGNRTILVSAYDSRNNSTTVTQPVTVYDYSVPTIVTTLVRLNNFDTDTTISISGTYSILTIGGTNKNILTTGTLQYRYKEDGGVFGSWVTKTFTANTTAGTFTVTDFVVSLDNTKKYDFEFHIDDKFGTVTTTTFVDVGTPIMFVGKNGSTGAIGVNKMPTNGALDVVGDIYSNGLKVSTYVPIDYSTSELNTGKKWTGGETIYRKVITATINVSTAGAYYTFNHGISSLSNEWEIVSHSFTAKIGQGASPTGTLYFGSYRETGGQYFNLVEISKTSVKFVSSYSWGSTPCTFVIEYVK